ncbi:MAG: hypothetical protein HF314_12585 [Ignavibacteria bacterium]|nr:hypothetical protein [Ignavibacteria bacterium]MCU7503910.1 hypothetical protein [Ignavibacteria bacterium]MCU7515869.1 hypothetical protein [Ignavibacteria bacterium]
MYSKFKYIYLLVLTGFSMFLTSCSDDPTSTGLGLLDNYIALNADSSVQTESASYFRTAAQLSSSDRILLGRHGNLKASMLVQFALTTIPDTTRNALKNGTLSVKSATIEMSPVYTIGSSSANFDFSVHKIKDYWSQYFTADSISKLSYDAPNLKTSLDQVDTLYTMHLDNNAVAEMLKDSNYVYSKNYGFYFEPSSNSGRIVGFQAIALSPIKSIMYMKVVFARQAGGEYTLSFSANNDLHTISGTMPQVSSTDLVVQGGLAVSSKFMISTANIPEDAIINSAILELTVDTLNSVLGSPASNYLVVKFVTNGSTNSYDSTKTTVLNRSGNVFSGNIASHIQRWVNHEANNGLMISLGDEVRSADLYSFLSSNSASRPRLKILYTAKKK